MNEASSKTRVLALSGGVGGAKLAQGLAEALENPPQLTVVCNTADDFEHLGLSISPDLDSVMYRLAGLHDSQRGWGQRDETWHFLEALRALGGETWFQLGDRDLATHVQRTQLLENGATLSVATQSLCSALGIACRVAPMSDHPVRTRVHTDRGTLDFQHYFVREQCRPRVSGFDFHGVEKATPSPCFLEALASEMLELVVLCPSNPYVSMDPILALPGVEDALRNCSTPIVAVSPIFGRQALKGPAAKMMEELGHEPSAFTVAQHYAERGLVNHYLIDPQDREQRRAIEELGLEVLIVPALLNSTEQRAGVTQALLSLSAGRDSTRRC